jgi:alkanesulfonate monooxygenase SsuD/methylene tetrahydromethanopterin reductase-like flavin-dependent oxidoreductase (luciferase family)
VQTSIAVTNFSWPDVARIPDELTAVVEAADASVIDTVWLADHLMQAEPGTAPDDPMLEAYATLGYLAAQTRRVRLGTLVAAATMRPPAVLIKAVTTLDVLSRGRAWLGIGAGYHADEAAAFGVPLPATAARFEWLDDTLRLAQQMWSGDGTRFVGHRVVAEQPVSSPAPATRPHPPILIGGTGETRTLPLVARFGDACNLFDIPDGGATIRHKLSVLADHCARIGRRYEDVEKTVSTRLQPADTADAFAARARTLGGMGIDHVVVLTEGPWTRDRIDVLAEAAGTIASVPTRRLDR